MDRGSTAALETAGSDASFLRLHFWLPLSVGALLMVLFASTDLDRRLERAWAYDAATARFPERGTIWADDIVHLGGRTAIALVATLCLVGWVRAARAQRSEEARAWAFSLIALTLSAGIAAGLKQITDVDCPWDLQGFGGDRPFLPLLAARPGWLPVARCFPGAHSASGFALFALYFGFRDTRPRVATRALLAALIVGSVFGLTQQARGAHFLSHDLASAFIVWFTCLGLYLGVKRWRGLNNG
jgi:membrane-associated PAP2 superfamily phosphatase